MKSPIVLLQAFLTDVRRLEPDVKGLDRDYVTIKARVEHEGSGFLSVALPTLRDAIDHGLSCGQFSCPCGFRRIRKGALPRLFAGLLREVFDATTGNLRAEPNVRYIRILREVLSLFKKLRSTEEGSRALHCEAVATFWDNDVQCGKNFFNPRRASLLARVSRYCLVSLTDFERFRVRFKHGPGAVFEGRTANQKWSAVDDAIRKGWDLASSYGFDGFISVCQPDNSDWGDCSRDLREEPSHERKRKPGGLHRLSSGNEAKLITVAKNSTSRRTITVEPVLNMFVQQGLNTELRDSIERCSVLSNCLALTDQSKNQQLALEGSRTGKFATLDLKSASDLLSLDLVKLVFGGLPSFLEAMLECRSTHVIEEGTNLPRQLAKFAGMGNALTFPTQSVVFACLAITAILSEMGSFPSYGKVRAVARRIQVYGDDIIVPTEHAHQVIDWLTSFGLKVNHKKSFIEGNFRESCGVDAFRGTDVTPIYVKAEPVFPRTDASSLAEYVSLSNQFWMKGLYTCSDSCAKHVESILGRKLPIVRSTSGALGWTTRYDDFDIHRWNQDLHRHEVRAFVVLPKFRKDKLTGTPALLKSLLTPLIQRDERHMSRSVKRFENRIALRWMPV